MSTKWAKAISCVIIWITLLENSLGVTQPKLPESGVLPNETTTVRVAEAIFESAYGALEVARWKPYHTQLDKNAVWTVFGTLPRGTRGGTPMLKIRKDNGTVLEIWFSQ
jgi:hypothetical protein